jgi:hypothetical protein
VSTSTVEAQPPVRTEFRFTLPVGYIDSRGALHREGTMRMATARDELSPQSDVRVRQNPSYLTVLLLERTVTHLGKLAEVDTHVIENLFAADLAFLQGLYRRVNQEGHTEATVSCPGCQLEFTVDLAGDALGGA